MLPHGDTPFFKRELFECIVEITTPVSGSASEIADALAAARARAADVASEHGLCILASGAFPSAIERQPNVTDTPRYRDIAERLGPRLYGQLVCGLHLHVGLGTKARALNALEGVIPWLPNVLAVSANSVLAEGTTSSLLSVRSARLAELDPSLLSPPAGTMNADSRKTDRGWWDARFNERWGTLEIRVPDQPTDVRRSGAIAALVQALVLTADQTANRPADRAAYRRWRRNAARGRARHGALARQIEPVSRKLGTWATITELLESGTEAERQLRLHKRCGRAAFFRELFDRSVSASAGGR